MSSRPLTTRTPAPVRQLPSLTALRGLAALWVVLFHYSVLDFPRLDITIHSHLIGKGYLAVDLFFMLSGLVMTHVYYRAFCESVPRHYWSFLAARIARLYPLHLVMLLLFVATALATALFAYAATGTFAGLPLHGARSLSAFTANLFMLQGLNAAELSWNFPSWSISVEFMAYVAFPFALPFVWRAGPRLRLVLFSCVVAALLLFAALAGGNFNQWTGPIALMRCLPEFILGTLLYRAYHDGVFASFFQRDAIGYGALAVAVLSLHFGAPDIVSVALFPVLILAALGNAGTVAQAINTAPLLWLGEISYSLYLIHGLVDYIVTQVLDGLGVHERADLSVGVSLALLTVMLAIALIAAGISYRTIEIAWRGRLRALLSFEAPAKPRPAAASARIQSTGITTAHVVN